MYIDAKKIGKHIFVSERNEEGNRSIKTHLPNNVLYYPDPNGDFEAITGERLNKFQTHNWFEFKDALEHHKKRGPTFESDINPVFRLLEERYPGNDGPPLNLCIFDIEVDKDPEKGFATIKNPYAPINAISLHNKWTDEHITLIVPPPNLSMQQCRDLLDGKIFQDKEGNITDVCPEDDDFGPLTEEDGYFLIEDEEQLLRLTVDFFYDADVVSGWNSTFFDIPYIIQRIRIVLGGESIPKLGAENGTPENPYNPTEGSLKWLHQLCLFPCPPTMRMVENFGSLEKTYNLHGRVHLDYLDLYRKFTYEELHSYALDFVLEHEVNQNKVTYEGSLDQLYRWDLRRFTAYSRQDVAGLSALDDKMKFVDLANSMAHLAGVTLDKVLGSVVLIEQAILKVLHQEFRLICFDKSDKEKDYPIPGAYVLEPTMGLYNWIASFDFNSLYPTVIRMLNISPETIVGWVNPKETLEQLHDLMEVQGMEGAQAWAHFPGTLEYNMVIEDSDEVVEFQLEGTSEFHEETQMMGPERLYPTGRELNEMIKENDWVITAFGLVLHREKQGIIPYCLELWYDQRTKYKKQAKEAWNKAQEEDDPVQKAALMAEHTYFDMLQLVQKIFLNSTYGALLNAFCRFYDPRMGASVTMSGKICLGEMVEHAEKLLTEENFHE